MKFKYLQNMYVPMVLTQDTSQQHVAGINSQCTHLICTTKSLLRISLYVYLFLSMLHVAVRC